MKPIFKAIVLVVFVFFGSASAWANSTEDRNYFQFVIPKYQTHRQGGQTISVYVRFAYKQGLPESQYVDYRLMRKDVLSYLEPSDEYPINVFWEILATTMGHDLMKNYPIEGVSVQLVVFDNQNPDTFEPGDHGPVFTTGNIEPLSIQSLK